MVCMLVVLGLALIPSPCGCAKTAKINMVTSIIGESGTMAAAIEHYRYDVGEWPAFLDDLCFRPTGRSAADNWAGPYIDDPSGLSDPWGNSYRLDAPGRHRVTGYDLWSAGPDGRYGTADDIANWTESSRSTISPP